MPLSEQQQMEFRMRAEAAGATPEQIERVLTMQANSPLEAKLSGGGKSELGLPPPAPLPKSFYGNLAAETGKMALTTVAGGPMIGAMSKLPVLGAAIKSIPSLFRAGGQAAGQFVGETGRQKIMGEPRDVKRAATEAGIVGGLDLALRGGIGLARRMGGIRKETAAAAMADQTLLREAPRRAEYDLVRQIADDAKKQAGITTPGREAFEKMMTAHDISGWRVNGAVLLDAIDNETSRLASAGGGPNARAAMMRLAAHRKRVSGLMQQMAPNGMLTAAQYDELLRGEFTAPLYEGEGKIGNMAFRTSLENARNGAASYFYDQIGEGAASAASMAKRALDVRETVENLLPSGSSTKPTLGTPSRVAQASDPANVAAGPAIEDALKAYDEQYGSDFWGQVQRLGMQRELTPLSKKSAEEVVQLPVIGYKPRDIITRAAAAGARGLIKGRAFQPGISSLAASKIAKAAFGPPVRVAPNSPSLESGADDKTPEKLYGPDVSNLGNK